MITQFHKVSSSARRFMRLFLGITVLLFCFCACAGAEAQDESSAAATIRISESFELSNLTAEKKSEGSLKITASLVNLLEETVHSPEVVFCILDSKGSIINTCAAAADVRVWSGQTVNLEAVIPDQSVYTEVYADHISYDDSQGEHKQLFLDSIQKISVTGYDPADSQNNIDQSSGETAAKVEEKPDQQSNSADQSIVILNDDLTVHAGKQIQIKTEVVSASGTAQGKTSLQWSSLDPEIAKVTSAGQVIGVAPGHAKITCCLNESPEITKTFSIQVIQPVKSIQVESGNINLLCGASAELARSKIKVSILPENATDPLCLYSSSDDSVVIVDAEGKVQAVSPGRARITIIPADGSGGVKATCNVTVGQAVSSVSIPSNLTLDAGKNFNLKPEILPDNASQKKLEYVSSDPAVAKVSNNGLITAVKKGKATITALAADGSGVSAKCTVTVVQMVKSIRINNPNVSLEVTKSLKLMPQVSPEDATDKTVRWETSDSGIVSVTAGTIKAIKPGRAQITCTASDGSGAKAVVNVQVTKYKGKTDGKISNGFPAFETYTIPYTVKNELKSGGVNIQSLTVQKLGNGFLRFRMRYQAPAGYSIYVFSPPRGDIFGFYAKRRTSEKTDTIEFEIYEEELYLSGNVTINIVKGDRDRFFIFPNIDANFKKNTNNPLKAGSRNTSTTGTSVTESVSGDHSILADSSVAKLISSCPSIGKATKSTKDFYETTFDYNLAFPNQNRIDTWRITMENGVTAFYDMQKVTTLVYKPRGTAEEILEILRWRKQVFEALPEIISRANRYGIKVIAEMRGMEDGDYASYADRNGVIDLTDKKKLEGVLDTTKDLIGLMMMITELGNAADTLDTNGNGQIDVEEIFETR